MSPPPLPAISGSAAWVQINRPHRFTSIIWRHWAVSAPPDGTEQHQPGVVDERVQPAVLGVRGLDERARLRLVRDVHLVDRDRALQALGELLEPVPATRRERHRGARRGERVRGGRADPGRGAGDRGYAALQWLTRHAAR